MVLVPPGKTPISYLQELCNKSGQTAQYDVIANEGTSVHQPEFVIQVIVGETVETGRGSSKKKAKHAAALAILQQLSGLVDSEAPGEASGGSKNGGASENNEAGGQNPIGELQEFTQKNHLKPPEFIISETARGASADVEFSCDCKLGKHSETGTGASKKAAKRNAACNMLTFIQSLGSVKSDVIQDEEEEEEDLQLIIDIKNRIEQAKKQGKNLPVSSADTAEEIKTFYTKIMQSGRIKHLNQQNLDTSLNYVRTLQDIAHSQSFEIRYIDLPEKDKTGHCQCLLQLSTLPVAVVHGTGGTPEEARSLAAYNALLYLKVMLKDL